MGIIFEEICAKLQADSKYRPTKVEVERFNEELNDEREISTAEGYRKLWEDPATRNEPIVIDVIQLPPDWAKSVISPKKVYWHIAKGKTVGEIAKELGVNAARIQKVLDKAAKPGAIKSRYEFELKEIPFGWKTRGAKLVPDEDEQWILEKIEMDLARGRTEEEIVKSLTKLGIKPKGGGLWFERRVQREMEVNFKLLAKWKAGEPIYYCLKAST